MLQRAQETVYSESFVYTAQIRDEIMKFLWGRALDGDESDFDADVFLVCELHICGYYIQSMLYLTLRAFSASSLLKLPNFSEPL